MTSLLLGIALSLAVLFVVLLATIVVRRALADRRRRRDAGLRPGIELAVVEYLAAEDAPAPALADDPGTRRLLGMIAVGMIGELRGRERDRLVALLERTQIVGETAAELGSRRRPRRRLAAETLRRIASADAAPALVVATQDPDLDTRLTCAAALAELADTDPIAGVLDLADAAAMERPGAVAAILVTLGRRHPGALGDALALGRSSELRRLAAAVVGELRVAEHAEALRDALADPDDELVARAARGLGMIGDAGAVDALLTLAETRERAWFVRIAATGALGELGDERALAPLERGLREDGWTAQAKAARALRSLGGPGEAVLREALDSPVQTVREHASVALGA
ncbi:MAG TPA: HEAT repeat domain-containing protein [Solirubrobacteraceae bacterium]|nr:HEAT repeat domain-containing protein [Solirubrobacteraceae bacterium]